MKKFSFLILTLLLCVTAHSQIGIKAGVDYGTLTGREAINYRLGFHGGFTYDFQLSEQIYIQPALLASLHSFGLKELDIVKQGKVNKVFVEVPVNLSFRPKINYSGNTKLVIDLGPYIKYGFAGDKYVKLQNIVAGDTQIKGSSFDGAGGDHYKFNRLDAGVNVGFGFEFSKIYAGVSYQYSLTKGTKSDLDSTHNSIFRFSLGYRF
jgi:hypothetical protein